MVGSTATTSDLMTFHTATLKTFSDAIIHGAQGSCQFEYYVVYLDIELTCHLTLELVLIFKLTKAFFNPHSRFNDIFNCFK